MFFWWAGDLSSFYSWGPPCHHDICVNKEGPTTSDRTWLATCLVCICCCTSFRLCVYDSFRWLTHLPSSLIITPNQQGKWNFPVHPMANLHLDVVKKLCVCVWVGRCEIALLPAVAVISLPPGVRWSLHMFWKFKSSQPLAHILI